MRPFEPTQFYEAINLLCKAKQVGLQHMGLVKVTIEADAITMGLLPAIIYEPARGEKLEYLGDDFYEGLKLLRHYIDKGSKEVVKRGKAEKP